LPLDLFPGRDRVLDRLARIHQADKLGQPLLFVGGEGSGKEATALEFARRLDCAAPDACAPGNRCESCVKALTFQHPDIRWFGPAPATVGEDEVRELLAAKAAQPFLRSPWTATSFLSIGDPDHPGPLTIRSLIRFLRRRAFQSPWKVAVVADAQRLNPAAANAFLKTLEEPPPRTVIMLLTTGTAGMLPTILSRCQTVRFAPWPAAAMAALLGELTDAETDALEQAARAADGNIRRALALLEPETALLTSWARRFFRDLHAGDRAAGALLADDLHRGVVPPELLPPDATARQLEAKEPAARRNRAIRLCELLIILYSDAVNGREAPDAWRPRLPAAAAEVAAAVARRRTPTLLRDLAAVEEARRDLVRNLNVGLVMAVLSEELIDHVQRDQRRTGAGQA
jgi:DNA polymerase-3 subunit delta'